MTIQNRLPLALDYGDDGSPSGLAEYSISSVDLADVATLAQGAYPQPFQVLAWSSIGDGSFMYAPSTINLGTGGGGGNFETCESLTGCSITKLSDVCTDSATVGEVLAYNSAGKYCPSTLNYANNPTGGTNGDIVIKGAGGLVYSPPGTVAASLKTAGGYAVVSAANAFTDPNTFTGGVGFTGTNTFASRPTTGGVNYVLATDLDAYVTEDEYDASADAFTTTATFYTTTGTLLEKPSTGGNGDLLLYSTGNNTATTSVADFIADQDIVVDSDLTPYATTAFTDSKYNTTATFFATTATLATNANLAATAAAAVQVADTTANSRTFLGTNANIQNLDNVDFDDLTTPQILVRQGSKVFASAMNAGTTNFLFMSDGAGNGSIDFTPSTAGSPGSTLVSKNVSGTNVSADSLTIANNITVGGTVDGVDIASRDSTLTSTTTTANNALPKAGGTMTGTLQIDAGVPKIILKDTTDDDDHSIVFRTNGDVDEFVIRTGDKTGFVRPNGLALGDCFQFGSENNNPVSIMTNGKVALLIDDAQNLSTSASVSAVNLSGAEITAEDNLYLSGNLNVPDYTSLTGAGVPMVLHREVGAPVASSNSTSLTELVSYTLPANILTLGDIDIMIRGRQLAQGSNLRWNFMMGGTNILNSAFSQGTYSDMTAYTMDIQISKTATDKQLVTANFRQSTGSSSAAGRGSWSGIHRDGIIVNYDAAGDESGTLELVLQAQQSDAAQIATVDQFVVKLVPNPA